MFKSQIKVKERIEKSFVFLKNAGTWMEVGKPPKEIPIVVSRSFCHLTGGTEPRVTGRGIPGDLGES